MKGEPCNLESALNYATKYEAYEHSLISQGSTWDRTDIGTIKMDKGSLYFSDSMMPIGKENA